MIIGKLDADGWKIKEVDIPERELIFCEVCGKEVKGKSIGERTEYPIHFSTRFIFCAECQKKIRQDLEKDLPMKHKKLSNGFGISEQERKYV